MTTFQAFLLGIMVAYSPALIVLAWLLRPSRWKLPPHSRRFPAE